MLAHVEQKNHVPRKDENRISVSDAEKLKVPLPVLGHREHRRQHNQSKQHRDKSGKSSELIKGAGQDESANPGIVDNITDDAAALHDWQPQTQQQINGNNLSEFDDIDDMFVYHTMDDQQIEVMKQRLTDPTGYKSTDKYIEGDSYPDTTSGHLTDVDMQPRDDYSMRAVQDTVVIPRTRSAGESFAGHQRNDLSASQPFFTRHEDLHGAAPAFQMPMMRLGQSAKPTVQPQVKQDNRPSSRATLYQQVKPAQVPAVSKTPARFRHSQTQSHPVLRPIAPAHSHDNHVERNDVYRMDPEQGLSPIGMDHEQDESAVPQSPILDHDLEALHKMEYKQLKDEGFDHDPRGAHSDPSSESIPARLNSLATLPPDEWPSVFHSLDLDKWEEAGDWFIDQYSSILTRLKDLRQQRRAAAQAFELEIDQRQKAIVYKRIAIQNTMDSMRTHGAQVLVSPANPSG